MTGRSQERPVFQSGILTKVSFDAPLVFIAVDVAVGANLIADLQHIGLTPPAAPLQNLCRFVGPAQQVAQFVCGGVIGRQ